MPAQLESETHSAAERYVEEHATITRLRSGSWRAWIKRMPDGTRVLKYGSRRELALADAATELLQRYPYRYE